jgi:S-adenosylmethionine decarboxylase
LTAIQRDLSHPSLAAGHFGEHLTLDGYGGDPIALDDGELLRFCLEDLCARLQMHPLSEPVVLPAPDNQIKDPGGWSGFLIIAESHISIHTFPRRRFLSADIYTCRHGMDAALVSGILSTRYSLAEVESHFIRRGQRYPAHNLL